MINGTTQSIRVTSSPVAGAECTLQNAKGVWHVTTPATITVHKADDSLHVTCAENGYADASIFVRRHMNGVTFLGGPAGVGVDASDGALFSYPDAIDVPMTQAQTQAPAAASNPS